MFYDTYFSPIPFYRRMSKAQRVSWLAQYHRASERHSCLWTQVVWPQSLWSPRAKKPYLSELTPLQRACALLMVVSRRVKSLNLTKKMDYSISLGRGVGGGSIGR